MKQRDRKRWIATGRVRKSMGVSEHEETYRLKIRAFILPSVRFDNPIFGSFHYMILLHLHKFVVFFPFLPSEVKLHFERQTQVVCMKKSTQKLLRLSCYILI